MQELDRRSLPRTIRDIYGRELGHVVGAVLELDGEIASVGVDGGAGRFVQYPSSRLIRTETEYLVMPEWKAEAQGLAKEHGVLRRRAKALEELEKSGDSSAKVLDDLRQRIERVRIGHEKLAEQAHQRLEQLDREDSALADFLAMAKLQLRSSEIDESTYRATAEFSHKTMGTNGKEKEELRRVIGYIENIEEADDPSPVLKEEPVPEVPDPPQPKPEPVSSVKAQPFPEVRMSLKSLRKLSE